MFPEITVTELGEKLKSDEKFILLDIRELSELEYAKITDSRLEVTPMSRLAAAVCR
jgi:rhodanese-related sulfurtransferase